jgi:hypothetical protein
MERRRGNLDLPDTECLVTLRFIRSACATAGRAYEQRQVVAGIGIPAVSQAARAYVAAVRGTQAATGTAFDGRTLSRAERVDAAVSAVGGIASAAGAGRAAAALNVVAGGTSAVVAASRGDRVGAALGVLQAVVGARGLRGGGGAPRSPGNSHPRAGQSKAIRAGCGCFVGSVTVDTPSGPRAIETIRVGDVVLAKNENGEGEVRERTTTAPIIAPLCLLPVTYRRRQTRRILRVSWIGLARTDERSRTYSNSAKASDQYCQQEPKWPRPL